MRPNFVEISTDLYTRLKYESEKLGVPVNVLVEDLVRKFIQSQEDQLSEQPFQERRAHARTKINKSAVMFFRTANGRYSIYKSGDVKDIAPGGVLLECGMTSEDEPLFTVGREFELIFQMNDEEPPMHILCHICRIEPGLHSTRLGVSFSLDNSHRHALKKLLS